MGGGAGPASRIFRGGRCRDSQVHTSDSQETQHNTTGGTEEGTDEGGGERHLHLGDFGVDDAQAAAAQPEHRVHLGKACLLGHLRAISQ